jgi:hypothetical protein
MRMQSTWPRRPLVHVVGGIDLSAEAAEGEQLVTGTPNLAEQFTAQRTIGYAGQDGIEIAFELTLTVFHLGYGQFGDVTSEVEGTIKSPVKNS